MSEVEVAKTEEVNPASAETPFSEPSVTPEVTAEEAEAQTPEQETPATDPTETDATADDDVLTIDSLHIGQHLTGTVKNITDFGAFVDVGIPQDGLVHISKLAKRKVDQVTDVVSVGQKVDVWVKKVDKKRGRLSLTMIKPVTLRLRDIKEGAELEGVVARLESYGAFIDIGSEREGLVHISQISHDYIKHPEESLELGEAVRIKVLKVDRKKRQVDLSIKELLPPPVPETVEQKRVEEKAQALDSESDTAEEEPALTAMAVAITALQDKQESAQEKKSADKKRQADDEMDAIISRTLATRK